MVRFPYFPRNLVLSGLAILSCLPAAPSLFAQHEREVPAPREPRPFSDVPTRQTPLYSVEFRSGDELSQQDKLLLADAESSIAEHAGFAGMEYQQNGWNYSQIVCPGFPNHLFLEYTRNQGEGDKSVFSVSIPRNGDGRVRVIPILKRGYSLFSPAPINALTISAFNHIRAEEADVANSDWLANALCYAALAGSRPQIMPRDASSEPSKPVPLLTAAMDILSENHGEEVIRFDDAAARPHPMEWSMTFTRSGKLVRATHRRASTATVKTASQKSPVIRTRPAPDLKSDQ